MAKDYLTARKLLGQPAGGEREIVRLRLLAEVAQAESQDAGAGKRELDALKHFAESVKYLEDAYEHDPTNVMTVAAYLHTLAYMGNYRTALRVYWDLPDRLKRKPSIKFAINNIYKRIGWWAKANRLRPAGTLNGGRLRRLMSHWLLTLRLVWRKIIKLRAVRIEDQEEKLFRGRWCDNLRVLHEIRHSEQFQIYALHEEVDQALIAEVRTMIRAGIVLKITRRLFPLIACSVAGMILMLIPGSSPTGLRVAVGIAFAAGAYFLASKLYSVPITQRGTLLLNIAELFVYLATGTILLEFAPGRSRWLDLTAMGFISASIVIALLIVIEPITFACIDYRHGMVARRNTRALVVDILADLLIQVKDTTWRNNLDRRRAWLRMLEYAAQLLERYGARQLFGRRIDRSDDFFSGAAGGIRYLKRFILKPEKRNGEKLVELLVKELTALATGSWGDLRMGAVPQEPTGWLKRILPSIKKTTTVVTVAILPAAALFSLHFFIDFGNDVLKWVRVTVIGWAVITVLHAIDPDRTSKLLTDSYELSRGNFLKS
jgi:hypothetical protein